MIDFNSPKVNILAYCLATLTTSILLPQGDNLAGPAVIGCICGYWFTFMAAGLGISFIIYLIRIIFNRKNQFEFFINTLWCSTCAFSILSVAGMLAIMAPTHAPFTDYLSSGLLYNLAYFAIAIFMFHKKQQIADNSSSIYDMNMISESSSEKAEKRERGDNTEEQLTEPELKELPPPIPTKKAKGNKHSSSFKRPYLILGVIVLASITLGSMITSLLINNSDGHIEENLEPEKYLVVFDNGFQIWDNKLYLNNYQMLKNKRPEISIYKLQPTTNIDIDKYFYVTNIADTAIWNGEKLLSKIAELQDTYPSCMVYQLVHVQGIYENSISYTAKGDNYDIPLDLVKDFTSDFPDAKLIKQKN